MAFTQGNCCQCDELLVILKWHDGKRTLVVGCHKCKVEMRFDLAGMIEMLGCQPVQYILPGDGRVH